MKTAFLPLLIIGLLLSASFGLVMMNHLEGQVHSQCPFETKGIADCAQVQNPLDFVVAHRNALAQFSSAIPVNNFAGLVSLVLLFALAILFIFNQKFELFKLKPLLARNQTREAFIPPNKILLTHWFALHENSPAFIKRR